MILVVWLSGTLLGVVPVPPASAQDEVSGETRARRLADEVEQQWSTIEGLLADYAESEGDERLVIDAQIERRADRIRETLYLLYDSIMELEAAGKTVEQPRAVAERFVVSVQEITRQQMETNRERMGELARERSTVAPDEALGLERKLTQFGVELDNSLDVFHEFIGYEQALGLETDLDIAYLDGLLQERGDQLASELEVVSTRVRETGDRLSDAEGAEATSIRSELTALQERLNAATSSMELTVRLLDKRGIPSAEYKQVFIRTTGNVTTDILDTDVAMGLARDSWKSLKRWVAGRAPQFILNLLIFAVILLVFRFIARIVQRVTSRALARQGTKVPQLLRDLLIGMASKLVMVIGILIGLSQLGVEIGPLLAGLGVAGFIVGFALQNTLSNFASGMMILLSRPFDVGDVIEAGGVGGKVGNMSLVSTTILTFDNQRLVVPNNKIWGDVIRNKTAEDTRRVDLVFSAGYEDDLSRARQLLEEVVRSHELVLEEPKPVVTVNAMKESSVEFVVRPWVKTQDYWKVHWDLTNQLTTCYEKLSVPYPRRDVLMRERPNVA